MENIILLTDSYKLSHYNQYPPKTKAVYSYLESRGGQFKHTVFFGLQYILKKYLAGKVITQAKIDEAEAIAHKHFGDPTIFNKAGWQYILDKHQGYLPVVIHAVAEGSVVDCQNVLMTVENTDENCYWLTNYLETLLMHVWYGSTVATISYEVRKLISNYLVLTGTPETIEYKLHDFGFRGVSSVESAAIGAAAHLINFKGTDTLAAIPLIQQFYHCAEMPGYSIPATEHSTITSWGRLYESAAYENFLEKNPSGTIACVSDSYNIFHACEFIWGDTLIDKVLKRDGVLVIRPDSGDPKTIIPQLLATLASRFGHEINQKGYKVLNPKVRLIQGDGVGYVSIKALLDTLQQQKWSADNIIFGMGGALLQKINRDTQSFAYKCSWINIENKGQDVFKDPITDPSKTSKLGRFKLLKKDAYITVAENEEGENQLLKVFENGKILKEYSFDEVRNNAYTNSQGFVGEVQIRPNTSG